MRSMDGADASTTAELERENDITVDSHFGPPAMHTALSAIRWPGNCRAARPLGRPLAHELPGPWRRRHLTHQLPSWHSSMRGDTPPHMKKLVLMAAVALGPPVSVSAQATAADRCMGEARATPFHDKAPAQFGGVAPTSPLRLPADSQSDSTEVSTGRVFRYTRVAASVPMLPAFFTSGSPDSGSLLWVLGGGAVTLVSVPIARNGGRSDQWLAGDRRHRDRVRGRSGVRWYRRLGRRRLLFRTHLFADDGLECRP